MKFNITASELKIAYEYAVKHGKSDFATITITIIDGDIGETILISNDWDDKDPMNITNYKAW